MNCLEARIAKDGVVKEEILAAYDENLKKSYTLEEWRVSHADDRITLLEKVVVDSLRSYIADVDIK